ncbi:hydroxyacylglutathione hydrolase [Sphaeroforma arctica JP610]|uniref:hydroxyacylglutathione hydrolase n=1 Tax=Sphaeroforma arctica JP610 TaxID=667725 RepID=A0A0L0FP74_9EUKA|nr:hydroxyacylglutathione hydrolase [Sphaeroforma arctica JP610]KNC78610.1 hydroxyacylglutathione hydrolase [Sphaeroforma arctica JP610]|eukprot:XP_014152512.1 hydroxyacylglutathione hydrolase [Sphaeroforma arctica JP610]
MSKFKLEFGTGGSSDRGSGSGLLVGLPLTAKSLVLHFCRVFHTSLRRAAYADTAAHFLRWPFMPISTVIPHIRDQGVNLKYILTTHNHYDHAGGNSEMAKTFPDAVVVGGKGDKAEAVTKEVWQDDQFSMGTCVVKVISTPCHTPGHVCYHIHDEEDSASGGNVFTGDTLFVAGSGNLNSGTPRMMHDALCNKLAHLPDDTNVWVGHEYTMNNLKFAVTVEPENEALQNKLKWAQQQRDQGLPTVPSTIKDEKETNPFVRCTQPSVQKWAGTTDPVEALATVRKRKSAWRG